MLKPEQIAELARSQAQFLGFALSHAHMAMEVMPTLRGDDDALQLANSIKETFLVMEATFERQFSKLGGFVDSRMGQTPVDLLTEWVTTSTERGQQFYTLSQWVMAQRLRSRLLLELASSPMPLVALSRFCLAIREEAHNCVQQAGGECAGMLAEHLDRFSLTIESYQERLATAHAKRA